MWFVTTFWEQPALHTVFAARNSGLAALCC
jgi:hypothetical protein